MIYFSFWRLQDTNSKKYQQSATTHYKTTRVDIPKSKLKIFSDYLYKSKGSKCSPISSFACTPLKTLSIYHSLA